MSTNTTTNKPRSRAPAMAIRKRRDHALEQVRAARNALTAAIRDVLNARSVRCAVGCKGWHIASVDRDPGYEVQRCDECARSNGYTDTIDDADLIQLPEAQRALQRAFKDAKDDDLEHVAEQLGYRIAEMREALASEGDIAGVAACDQAIAGDRAGMRKAVALLARRGQLVTS